MEQTYLFIGGPLDGKRILISNYKEKVAVPVLEAGETTKIVTYEKQGLSYGKEFFFCYVVEGINNVEALKKLFDGYNPDVPNSKVYLTPEDVEYEKVLNKHLESGGFLYAAHEGGRWQQLNVQLNKDEIIVQLYDKENWITTSTMQPGDISRTKIIDKNGEVFIVAVIKFPDGRIWDSYFRKFRDEVK